MNISAEQVTFGNDYIDVTITIKDAYYTDADGDGVEDDIISHFEIKSKIFDEDDDNSVDLHLIFNLILPSGFKYEYKFSVAIFEGTQKYMITYYHHATETGWYTETISGIVRLNGFKTIRGAVSLTFDPPEGDPGHEPLAILVEY
jgi:hypothetical protein